MAVADLGLPGRALLWTVISSCFLGGILSLEVGARLGAAEAGASLGSAPGFDDPPRDPAPPFWRIELRQELSRLTRLRIRDLGRATQLGLARAERLLTAAEGAVRRVSDTVDSPEDARARTSQLFESIWTDPQWAEALEVVLQNPEKVLWLERSTWRRVRRESTARILAATEISDRLHLTSDQRAVVIGSIGDLALDLPIDQMTIIDLQNRWATAAESFLQQSLTSAQRRRVTFGAHGKVAPEPRDLLLSDLEVWVAKVGDESGIPEQDRGILFDCGRRCIAVASIHSEVDPKPLEADLLIKTLRTIAGPAFTESFLAEQQTRKRVLREARWKRLIADLDALLFLTEVQRGALELVLARGGGGDLTVDSWAPLGIPTLDFPPEILQRLLAILDVDQRTVFRGISTAREGQR